MLSKIFKDDNVTFETRRYMAFIQTASYVPFCTYYAHYVYSVIRVSICEPGIEKSTQLHLCPLKTCVIPRIRQFEPGRHSALC